MQSGTLPGFVAGRVNDGSLNGALPACTTSSAHSWWAVDLEALVHVDRVTVTNVPQYRNYHRLAVFINYHHQHHLSVETVCLADYFSLCLRDNSKINDLKVFKLGTWNKLGIYYK